VFFELRLNLIVTLLGILTVVKLKTPLSGSCTVWLVVGLNGPSAPVEPLLKAPCARAAIGARIRKMNPAIKAEPTKATKIIFRFSSQKPSPDLSIVENIGFISFIHSKTVRILIKCRPHPQAEQYSFSSRNDLRSVGSSPYAQRAVGRGCHNNHALPE